MTKTDERKQFILDVFTTAMEGGIGYWSVANSYHYRNRVTDTDDLDGFYADIEDFEDDDKPYKITPDVIVRGLNLIVTGPVTLRSDLMGHILLGNKTNDGGEIDADCADCIVQAGLFGEVVYG